MSNLQIISISYFVVFCVVLLGVSIWSSKKKAASNQDEATEQFLAGKSTPVLVLAMSYCASCVSAGSFMGDPGMVSTVGYPYYWFAVFLVPGCVLPGLFIIRKMRLQCERLNCMTSIEYIGRRYDSSFLQMFIGIVTVVAFSMMMISQFKGAAVLLQKFTGLPFRIGLIVIGIAIIVCTVVGGMRSVAYTDCLQGCMMVVLCIVVISVGLVSAGGFSGIESALAVSHPEMLEIVQPGLWDDCGVLGVIGFALFSFFILFSQPYLTSRYMAMKDVTKKSIGKFLLITLFAGFLFNLMFINGMSGRVLFPDVAADEISVTLTSTLLPPVVSSAMMLGFFAAIISTATSVLLVIGQGAGRDIYAKINKNASAKSQLLVCNITCILVVLIVIGFNIVKPPEFLQIFLLLGQTGVGAAVCMPLFCGTLWKKSSKEGAIASAITGAGSTLWLSQMPVGLGVQLGAPVLFAAAAMFIVTFVVNQTKGVDPVLLERAKIGNNE